MNSLKQFPFDVQTCTFEFESWRNTRSIHLALDADVGMEFDHGGRFVSATEVWALASYNASVRQVTYANYPLDLYDRVVFAFRLQRKPNIYVVNIFFPCYCLLVLLISAGFMPPGRMERPGFCCTVVLAIAVLLGSIMGQIPKSSEIPYIFVFLSFKLATGVFTTFYALLAVNVDGAGDEHGGSSSTLKRALLSCCCFWMAAAGDNDKSANSYRKVNIKNVIRLLDVAVFTSIAAANVLVDLVIVTRMSAAATIN